MKSFIFIGQHKCGTTSIQDFLSSSYQKFQKGYLYPFPDIQSIINNRFKKALIKNIRLIIILKIFLEKFEPHNKLAFKLIDEKYNLGMPPWHTNEECLKKSLISLNTKQ